MKCKRVIRFIPEYLEGTLESSKVWEFESHLRSCDSCEKEFYVYQKTIQLSSSLPVEYPSEEVWDNFVPELLSKIEESSEKQTLPLDWQFIRKYAWQLAGAVISIAIIVAIVLTNFLFVTQPQDEPKTVREVIAENLITNNVSIKQIDQIIESTSYPVTIDGNMAMYVDEMNRISEDSSQLDAMDIANVIVTEIDSSELDYDYKLLEAIAYIEEYSMSKGE